MIAYYLIDLLNHFSLIYFVGEGGLPGTDSDDGNVIESARVGNGGWRQVALDRMGNNHRVHLLGDQVVAPVQMIELSD